EDIARRAGVTKGTVYLYFENKEALFKAMARHNVLPGVEAGEELLRTHRGSARDLVAARLRTRWRALSESGAGGSPNVVVAEAVHFPDVEGPGHGELIARA